MYNSMPAPARQEPALASIPLSDDDLDAARGDPRRRPSSLRPWIWLLVLVAVAAAAIGAWRMQRASQPAPVPAAETAPAVPPATAEAPPAIRYPVDAAPETPAGNASPPAVSDAATFLASLLALPGAAGLDRLVVTEDFVHRFVATIDNLPRSTVASNVLVVRPAEGALAIDLDDGRTALGRGNAARYAPYLRALQAAETPALVALYVRNYPLFQQAYRDLGYPNGYFNDRLVDVIDHLLATPEPAAPLTLLQPRVLYEFANPDLEARSAGQKALLRMGPDNERIVKAKLRELRAALVRSPTPAQTHRP